MSQSEEQQHNDNWPDLPLLPAIVTTLSGQKIETAATLWRSRSKSDGGQNFLINWSLIESQSGTPPILTRRAWYLVKIFLLDRLTQRPMGTVNSNFYSFLAFERWLAKQDVKALLAGKDHFEWSDYNEVIAQAFLSHGVHHTAKKGGHFSQLRFFYRWGVAERLPGFSQTVLRNLQAIKAPSNSRGQPVRSSHPTKGPLSSEEKLAIKQGFDSNKGSLQDRAIVRLHYDLGLHPYATVRLKNRDLKRYEANGTVYYQLDVPRVKKRTLKRQTKRRPISTTLGKWLSELQQGGLDAPLFFWLPSVQPEAAVSQAMHRFVKACHLISPITRKPLNLTPRRFRYTLATYLAEEGASNIYIAELLDHTTLETVHVYAGVTPLIAKLFAQATDPALVPLVRRFQGKIVESDHSAAFEGIPNQVIPGTIPHIPQVPLDIGGVGFCGRDLQKAGLCQFFPPLSCYKCSFFAALRQGPHRQLLQSIESYLTAHRDRLDRRILQQLEEVLESIRELIIKMDESAIQEEKESHEQ